MKIIDRIVAFFRTKTGANLRVGDYISTPWGIGKVTGGCINVDLSLPNPRFPQATDPLNHRVNVSVNINKID